MQDETISALVAAIAQPVMVITAEGLVQSANPAAEDIFGTQITGAQIRAHLRQPDVAAMLDRVLAGQPSDSASFVAHTGSHDTMWRVTARHSSTGLVVLSLNDISDIEIAEAQRRDFVANVSHELRSPLTVLTGFIETLQGPAGAEEATRAEFLDIMSEQAARMRRLVADLLSLSRVEAVEKIRPREPVSIEMVLRATIAALLPQIESVPVRLELGIAADLPEIPGDYDQLVQVFHNLIENSLKYGGSGGRLDVSASHMPVMPGQSGGAVRVSIRDYGEGIDPIYIPRLTERFYRIDKARSRDSGGTGLGLAIVKHILSRHRGRLVIRSAPGEGACFDAILPCG